MSIKISLSDKNKELKYENEAIFENLKDLLGAIDKIKTETNEKLTEILV